MRDGADRSDVDYAWPQTLRTPPRPPKLVYLDLNHWVGLAKVVSGHPDGNDHRDVFDACLQAHS